MGRAAKRAMTDNKLADEQKAVIDKFRIAVADILSQEEDDDAFLRRWLVARRWNIDKAEEMLRKHVHFDKVNELDKITPEFVPHEAANYFLTTMLGYDEDGSVVRLIRIGASDIKGITSALLRLDAIKHAHFLLLSDHNRQKVERKEKNLPVCDKQIYIMDLQGLAWRNIVHRPIVERTLLLLKTYEANHPENLKVAYIVNAPSFFTLVYNWLKTFLPDTIVTKIQVLSPDECASTFGKTIDLSIIPAFLGGTRIDPDGDPKCPSLFSIVPGTLVPERLLGSNLLEALLNDPEAKRTIVENRSLFKVEIDVPVAESILHWDFQTVQNDIRMALILKDDTASKDIIPLHRVDSHRIPESGRYECATSGVYEIVFDNTYSWMNKKELIYKVNVLLPNNNKDLD